MIKDRLIALIAHDSRKSDMMDWVKYNARFLQKNRLVCTGTTGSLIKKVMDE
jgi:methylglyoxal synthase